MKNVIIAGGGDVGYSIARTLSEEGHNITVVERNDAITERLEALDVLVVAGNAASPSVLDRAYVNSADYFIAVTGSDEINLAACSIAKNRGCKTLARINSEDYIQKPITTDELDEVGIDVAFCPELISSTHMSNVLSIPLLLDSPMFGKKLLRIVENRVDRTSRAVGKEIKKLKMPREVTLVAVFRNEEVLIPKGNLRLEPNDRVLAVIPRDLEEEVSERLTKLMGVPKNTAQKRSVDRVMIAGGSRVGFHLAKLLSENEMSVILIEEDEERCKEISEKLPDVLVINGNPTDKDLLKEEGVTETDAFLAVTDKEEVNILTALLARQYGAFRSISLVDRPGLKSILEEVGIDLVISPREVTLSTILKYFHKEDFNALGTLNQGEVQVIELKVRDKAKSANQRIDSIMRFKKREMVIGAIVRDGKIIMPRGDTFIHPKDRLMIFTKSKLVKWVKDHF
jgi:trk system potassium uptake protein TrkA